MQIGKNNNNRFRKLIPNSNKNINSITTQNYSAQFKPYIHSKIEAIYSNSHKTNYRSLQRQSVEDLKSIRKRQKVERRLRTISAAAFEGQKQSHEYKDNKLDKLKRSDKIFDDRLQSGKNTKIVQLMDLIMQFKFKTESILKYQEQQIQNQVKEQNQVDQVVFEEQICQLIIKTRNSSTCLMAIYINRLINQIKEDTFNTLNEYQQEILEGRCKEEQIKYQADSYLISNISVKKEFLRNKRITRERSNLMNVNKFFEKQ